MSKKYEFPKSMNDVPTHYCGGCGHGIVHKLIAQVIDEMNIQQDVLLVAPVGCAVYAYNYINVDSCEAAHGRAPAVATGMKRVHPDKLVISYQGDGDLFFFCNFLEEFEQDSVSFLKTVKSSIIVILKAACESG